MSTSNRHLAVCRPPSRRLSRPQVRARRRIADLAASGLPPEPLAARLMAAVEEAVPFDGFRLFGVDIQTLLINRLLAASQEDGWARPEWLREVYLAAGPLGSIEPPNLMRAGLPAVAFPDRQEACWGFPPEMLATVTPRDHHDLFHEIRSPVGGAPLGGFAAGGRWMAAFQAYRRDPDRPFRAGEVAFVRGISRAAGTARAASPARERAMLIGAGGGGEAGRRKDGKEPTVGDGATAASGIPLLEPGGGCGSRRPLATSGGTGWRTRTGTATGKRTPPAACRRRSGRRSRRCGRARRCGRSGRTEPSRRGDGETGRTGGTGVVLASSAFGPVRVEASAAGEDGATAIVLAPARPPEPPGVPPDWPPTPGERETVARLLLGAGNRQIAADLSPSEHTIEWHPRHAYEKLGVHSRTELLARYVQEAFLPGMGGVE